MAVCGPDSQWMTAEQKNQSLALTDDVREEMDALRRKRMSEKLPDISMRDAYRSIETSHNPSQIKKGILPWHITLISRDDCAAGDSALSLHHWDDGYEIYGYGDSVFMNGFNEIVQPLAQGLDIRLNCIVEEIDYSTKDYIMVKTSQGEFKADKVVITIPLGVLKSKKINFLPSLPTSKEEAIERIGFGNLTKVILHFDEVFWPENQYVFGYAPEDISHSPATIINLWKTHRIKALAILIGGPFSAELERWDGIAQKKWGLSIMQNIFGNGVPAIKEIRTTTWASDPYAMGSYSYVKVGGKPEDFENLAEPIQNRIFFAGEATNRKHWAAAHGAYLSGLNAAAAITGNQHLLPGNTATENRRWREMMMRSGRFFNELQSNLTKEELSERIELLNQCELFSVVPPNEQRILAAMFEKTTFDAGKTICIQGEHADTAYLIGSGHIRVEINGSHVARLGKGEVAGEYSMFAQGNRTASLIAEDKCVVLSIDAKRFQRFLLACPEASLSLMRSTVSRLIALNSQVHSGSMKGIVY